MSTNFKLIGEDMALVISIGGAWDGSLNPHGSLTLPSSPTNIMGVAKRVGLKASLEKSNVKAMGSAFKQNRYHSEEQTLEIEHFVSAEGSAIPSGAIGCYIYVGYNLLAGSTLSTTLLGVVTEWAHDAASATEQSVKITVDLCPDYLAP